MYIRIYVQIFPLKSSICLLQQESSSKLIVSFSSPNLFPSLLSLSCTCIFSSILSFDSTWQEIDDDDDGSVCCGGGGSGVDDEDVGDVSMVF